MLSHMKKIKYLYIIAAACALLFFSCSKKSNPAPAQSISLKFNGTAYSTTNLTANTSDNLTVISGEFVGQSVVLIDIPNAKVGSFDIPSSGANVSFANGSGAQNVYTANTGNITVTSMTSTSIAGTFEFTGNNVGGSPATVTSGQFQVKLP